MKLAQLLAALPSAETKAGTQLNIKGLAYHSQQVKPGYLFVCIKGFNTDGHLYAQEAFEKGALALVVERWLEQIPRDKQILVSNSRRALALLAASFYDHPTKKLQLVGVTGTNGKTTTTFLVESIFKAAGRKTGLIGTVEYRIGDQPLPVQRTTPESLDLQRLLYEMARDKVELVALEVSSHAIDLERVTGCQFSALVFTNLSQDHLDYHGNLENYFQVKSRLFRSPDPQNSTRYLLNGDDPFGRELTKMVNGSFYLYGINSPADIRAREIKISPEGLFFEVSTPLGNLSLEMKLKGLFNVYNALAALGVGISLGLPLEVIKEGLEKMEGVPGRFESIDCGQDFSVIVDYAHTPESLRNVLETARSIAQGRLITVFGCGGNRDREKRPLMGEVAARLSDFSIITSDNPRQEDPITIIDQIEAGFKRGKTNSRYSKIPDRRDAIFQAIALARKGDIVIIAGKGHEKEQIFADKTVPFDDCEVAICALRSVQRDTVKSY